MGWGENKRERQTARRERRTVSRYHRRCLALKMKRKHRNGTD